MAYKISIDNFQGPLELLYQLIKKNKIEISEISLARITGQYLSYLQKLNKIDLETCSEFTLIAVELIEIKARELLPKEEEEKKKAKKRPLVERLKEYRQFRELAKFLRHQEKLASRLYSPPAREVEVQDSEQLEISIDSIKLAEIYKEALKSREEDTEDEVETENMDFISEESIRIQDKIEEICYSLENSNGKSSFEQLLNNGNDPLEIVITLLSILEMARMKEVTIKQRNFYEGIRITKI
ncbi:MAG: segregation and condensation protein A [Bacillota bacterium]